uniref:V-type proton ATPase proteolipid subunit n=1 Tax=Odontella aurita TaxID=265563 RepID=A0A7S4HST0_9STRA|mmetsp:Transcript_14501/g.42487  ORF Transcript_14501/g.42487 Transcript_14501/m.42487 type:complete len:176 (+) Transcript_14501:307-834(+)|eukprot:CAMPEP_0113542926 /NCGR_PEP_ID=MMETSP0015_2-20120614/9881_1 /TAXON_ID=2838 /ORGANISM="Odontella" /LENGTH=175 /DNA_ID=CAMNT_0000443043 /DNA_START=180 /DNA_END=707 /DNA_ORIENTATION=+ /assembly_acc=CAM_ASM_000160
MANPQLMTGIGAAASIFLSAAGSAWASVPSGMFALRNSGIGIKAFFPIVISGVLAIYGTIVSALLCSRLKGDDGEKADVTTEDGYRHLTAGLAVGLACLASGAGMAKFLTAHSIATSPPRRGERDEIEEPLLALNAPMGQLVGGGNFWTFTCVLVFLEAIGLYGLIVALFLMGPK